MCYMVVEFYFLVFNICIIFNGIYSIDNFIVLFIKVFFCIVRYCKDMGIYCCVFVIKDIRDV